ncbi:ABC transporter substrate-binding protein [Halomarina ordinaria]|uniref:ABC transporter substrate-binding protein n=1 Tax=Halomarina ordinaria TaxID=3033939 RepID=A0ABD5U6J0_9EURY|nr:ABC transporter substrate-binding protein [Halomarina sp. PSRA2]
MHWRAYPVLPDDARYEEFRAGLDGDAARVLAYLVERRESDEVDPDEATRLAVRVGTGLGRGTTVEALSTLESGGLATSTTVASDTRGRPPKGWRAAGDRDSLAARVRDGHGRRLLERAEAVATHFGATLPPGWLDDAETAASGDADPATVRVALNWVPNGLHAPLIAAADFGCYEAHDVAVTLDAARGSGAAMAELRAGRADVAVVGAASVCRGADGSLVPLALLHQRSMAVLYTTTERLGEPFTSVEQLRGRRLAVPPDSEVGRLARLFLAQSRVADDVETVEVSGEEQAALGAGDAAVATGMPIDVHELATAGHDVASLSVADHFPVPGPALVTTTERLRDAPGTIRRFLTGTVEGATLAQQRPERTARRVADRSGDDVANERWRIEHARERATGERGWGWQTVDEWERLAVALRLEADG